MNRKVLYLPLAIFLILAAALMWQLMRNSDGDDPTVLESALVGKPLPDFRGVIGKPDVMLDPSNIINGKPVLINVWATGAPPVGRSISICAPGGAGHSHRWHQL